MKKKIALITGINGQDGSYLAEFLLSKGYEVHGTKRRSSTITTRKIRHLIDYSEGIEQKGLINIYHADLTDTSSLNRVIELVNPDEIYNLAAQSHVAISFEEPEYTANSCALGVLRILEIIKQRKNKIKFYQASTSELYGGVKGGPYNEKSKIDPKSPYAAAKAYAFYLVKQYREAYKIFAVNGILFNHESPRRGENFVTRKITLGISNIIKGKQNCLTVGNLNAIRDWGHAKEYVEAMYLMMQRKKPTDYVIGTGKKKTVRKFIIYAFEAIGIKIIFNGKGINETAKINKIDVNKFKRITENRFKTPQLNKVVVKINPQLFRPLETNTLIADISLAKKELKWTSKISIKELIKEMISYDLKKK